MLHLDGCLLHTESSCAHWQRAAGPLTSYTTGLSALPLRCRRVHAASPVPAPLPLLDPMHALPHASPPCMPHQLLPHSGLLIHALTHVCSMHSRVCAGAGQDVGRSCVVVRMGGKTVMFDCGMHMGYSDQRRCVD